MAPNDVNFRLSGDSGDAQRAWLEVIGVLKQTQNEIAKMGQRLETAGKRGNEAMEKQVTVLQRLKRSFDMLRNANAIIGGIRTAVNLLTGEIDAAAEASRRLTEPRMTYEQAKSALLANVSAAEYQAIIQEVEKYGGAIDRAAVVQAVAATSSTVALGMDKTYVARAAVDVSRAYPQMAATPEELNEVAMAAVALYNADPTLQDVNRRGMPDFMKTLEFIQVSQQKSAQFSAEAFGKFVVPSAVQMMNKYGYTREQAFAELAATQTMAQDRSGRMGSRTAVIAASQLASIGAQYGVGVLGEGRFDVPEIRKWMQEAATDDARRARREYLGVFDTAFEREYAGAEYEATTGRMQGAARYKDIYRDLTQGIGRVTELYTGALADLAPEAIEGELEAKARIRARDPGLALYRRQQVFQAFQGELQEMPTPAMTESELQQYTEIVNAIGGITGVEEVMQNVLGVGEWMTGATPEERLRTRIRQAIGELSRTGLPTGMRLEDLTGEVGETWVRGAIRRDDQEAVLKLLEFFNNLSDTGALQVRIIDDNTQDQAGVVPAPDPAPALGE